MTIVSTQFPGNGDTSSLARMILEMAREPVLVLDHDLNVQLASGSFHQAFQIDPGRTLGENLFAMDGGAWDIPALRTLLGPTLSRHDIIEEFKVTHCFPRVGERSLLLQVRRTYDEDAGGTIILLGFQDVTGHRAIELEKERVRDGADALLLLKEMLLREMQHRVLNSLQIVASILMLKARAVRSEESRQHLRDAHQRILSVAAVQQHLHSYGSDDLIAIGPYLKKLCESLSASIISEAHAASLQVWADDGAIRSGDAVNLGLIVTELVINALKYAFPDTTRPAIVTVRYKIEGARWMLSVSDNGVGCKDSPSNGLGTALVKSLARQLRAQVETTSSPAGLHVAITQTSADFVAGA